MNTIYRRVICMLLCSFVFFASLITQNNFVLADTHSSILKSDQTYFLNFNSGSITNGIYNNGEANVFKFTGDLAHISLNDDQLRYGQLAGSTMSTFDYGFSTNPDTTFQNFEVSYDMQLLNRTIAGGLFGLQFQKKTWNEWWDQNIRVETRRDATMNLVETPTSLVIPNIDGSTYKSISANGVPTLKDASVLPWSTYRVKYVVEGKSVKAYLNGSDVPIVDAIRSAEVLPGFVGLFGMKDFSMDLDNFLFNKLLPEEQRQDIQITSNENSIDIVLPALPESLKGYNIHVLNVTDGTMPRIEQYVGTGGETFKVQSLLYDKVYQIKVYPVYQSDRTAIDTEITTFKTNYIVIGNSAPALLSITEDSDFTTEEFLVKMSVIGADSIRYTLDGSEPSTTHGQLISGNLMFSDEITITKDTVLKAAAIYHGNITSTLVRHYRAMPNITVISEPYSYHEHYFHEPLDISLQSDFADAVIYTTDGTDPVYDGNSDIAVNGKLARAGKAEITITNTSTVKAAAVRSMKMGPITSQQYMYLPNQIQHTFYVDPENGNDENAGTLDQPFRTLERAQNAVRTVNDEMTGDIVVYLRGGTYQISETLQFDENDSGSHSFDVVYKAHPGETPVISGGVPVTGWTIHDAEKNIYKATGFGDIETRQLFINGVRAVRARSKGGLPDSTLIATGHTTSMTEMANWGNISDIEMVYNELWTTPRNGVQSISVISPGVADITMKQPGWNYNQSKGSTSPTKPWYIENAYELLDEQGEWYLDRTTDTLYYKPRDGENMSVVEAIIPIQEKLLTLKGSSLSTPIHDIRFEGITFSNTTWLRPSTDKGYPDVQGNIIREPALPGKPYSNEIVPEAAIVLGISKAIEFERCNLTNLGSNAINMLQGSQDHTIQGSVFYDISGTAIQIGETNMNDKNNWNPTDERYSLKNIAVTNNYIGNVGVDYRSAVGVGAAYPVNLNISDNEFFNMPYTGIHIGWGWNTFQSTIMKNNSIKNNYIHHGMLFVQDGAAIYTLGSQSGSDGISVIEGNYIQSTKQSFGGIYHDTGSSYWIDKNNVLSDVTTWYLCNNAYSKALVADQNYTDTTSMMMLAENKDTLITNTRYVLDGNWPSAAYEIMQNAGIKQPYRDIIFPVAPLISADNVLDDDFNEYERGWRLNDWLVSQRDGGILSIENFPSISDKSIKMYNPGSGIVYMKRIFKALRGKVNVDFNIRLEDVMSWNYGPYILDGNSKYLISFTFANGNMVYYNGKEQKVVQEHLTGTWYNLRFTIDTDTDTFDLYVDGVKKLSGEKLRIPATEVAAVLFGLEATNAGTMYVDNVRVTQALPDPELINLVVGGNILKEGESFEDYLPLTFKLPDNQPGIAKAWITVADAVYNIDPMLQTSIEIDMAGKIGSQVAVITLEDSAGYRLEKAIPFTVTTSIDSMKHLIDRYIESGELSGPLVSQLTNTLEQAKHQLEIDNIEQAAKHINDFIKHINNEPLNNYVSDNAKTNLKSDAEALVRMLQKKEQ